MHLRAQCAPGRPQGAHGSIRGRQWAAPAPVLFVSRPIGPAYAQSTSSPTLHVLSGRLLQLSRGV
eukprot:scaffold7599_cov417-Prasinococcus_capsulatus_cf.AAC.2